MMSHRPTLRPLAAAVAVAALLALPGAAPAAVDLCQKSIQKAGAKLDKLLVKDFEKCLDGYRKAVVEGASVAAAATTCNVQLVKAITFPDSGGGSALQQAKNALATLSGAICTDDDLVALGHLPEATFGDRWQRWLLVSRLASAYARQAEVAQDTADAFAAMAAAGGCPLCARLAAPPCFRQSCALGAGSGAKAFAPAVFSIALTGETVLDVCRYNDVLPNEYALVGQAEKTIARTLVSGTTLCTRVVGAEGYVACTGSTAPKVSYTACRDHIINTPDMDECAMVGVSCAASAADPIPEHAGSTNGGACLGFTSAPTATGAAFAMSTVEITMVGSTQKGPDGVACTNDDTAPPPFVFNVPLTTATATGLLFDAVNTPGNSILPAAVTGAGFSCTTLASGSLVGATLVGASPALHGLCLTPPCDDPTTPADEGAVPIDTVTTFTLVCQ